MALKATLCINIMKIMTMLKHVKADKRQNKNRSLLHLNYNPLSINEMTVTSPLSIIIFGK